MHYNNIIVEQEDYVLTIFLHRPEVLNALNEEMKKELISVFLKAKEDSSVKVILLSGKGKTFSSGGDIKGMEDLTPMSTYDYLGISKDLILLINSIEKPVIAAIHGTVAGGAVSLALACDIVLAREDTKLLFSFSKVGLIPDNGGIFYLVRILGIHRTKQLLFSADSIEAKDAWELGLINQIYSNEVYRQHTLDYAKQLSKGPRSAFGQIKKLANEALTSDLDSVLSLEQTSQVLLLNTEDHKEGVRAFREKRLPNFS